MSVTRWHGERLEDGVGYTGPPRGMRDVRVDPEKCPGWVTGAVRLPAPGERVYTNEGMALVVRVLGKTSAGGRLLELSMDDGRKPAFFAAAANVMVQRRDGTPDESTSQATIEGDERDPAALRPGRRLQGP